MFHIQKNRISFHSVNLNLFSRSQRLSEISFSRIAHFREEIFHVTIPLRVTEICKYLLFSQSSPSYFDVKAEK